jgi:hypothetical protein
MAAVGYALAGGVGAAVLAMVAPMLMHNYTAATAAGQALIAAQFATVLQVVWRAIWQFLDAILLAAWWLGIGWLLRADRPRLSRLSLVLAASAAAGAAANVAGLSLVRDVLLGVLFVLWTAWWISLFVIYARQKTNDFHHFPVVTEVRLPAGLVDRPALCGSLLDRPGLEPSAGGNAEASQRQARSKTTSPRQATAVHVRNPVRRCPGREESANP